MRHPDIYIEQANASGRIRTLRRRKHQNFVFYYPERIQTRITIGTNDITGKDRTLLPTSLKVARKARQEYIAQMEKEGRTIKGVRYLSTDLVSKLSTDRFIVDEQIRDMECIRPTLTKQKFILIKHAFMDGQGIIYAPYDFEDLTVGVISRAIVDKRIFTAFPRDEIKEI